ncbi:transcriptional coactivator-like protein [Paramagnetospirillum caucaseum]|uniref:Transcriptional coactivator-like protein n=1 Tax=Paramagnetospirillum caucaseum TaxID=1244869 RepID=M2ZLW3_9PROT|nr:transcriptional coactivator p15/PC4 family protein [Paramagnetospirillum caucaseum]EME68267.1 transcriptional coactivator-like protein [Paramagnetospirillum caucaseum]
MKQVIATIPKNASEVVKVELTEFNGHDLVGIRVWTKDTDRPTQKGVTVAVAMLPAILAALATAEAEARTAGLI